MSSLDDKGAGVDDEKRYPAAGDWVQVWGQVREGLTHPEDVMVEFFSHSEQWAGHIKTDRVVFTGEVPDFVETCTALLKFAGGDNGLLVRCVLHHGHDKKHRDKADTRYGEDMVVGYIEEA
jgi:hypothetical protein